MMGGNVGIWGWDGTNYVWVKLRVDADGHLQVDALSAPLPTDAATETTLALVESAVDGIETLLGAGLPVALDTLALKVREQGTPTIRCTGYDSANWQNLLVESSTNYNLRIAVYDGAQLADVAVQNTSHTASLYGLCVCAEMLARFADTSKMMYLQQRTIADALTNQSGLIVNSYILGYNGSTWDRLREGALSDTFANPSYALVCGSFLMGWDSSNSTWQRIRVSASDSIMTKEETSNPRSSGRLTASGLVWGASAHVYAITVNKNTTASAIVKLRNGLTVAGTILWEGWWDTKVCMSKNFYPWLRFDTGLYLDITGAVYSVIIEYGEV